MNVSSAHEPNDGAVLCAFMITPFHLYHNTNILSSNIFQSPSYRHFAGVGKMVAAQNRHNIKKRAAIYLMAARAVPQSGSDTWYFQI